MEQKDYDKEIAELKAKITELEKVKVEKKNNPFDVKDGDMAYYNEITYRIEHDDVWSDEYNKTYIPCKDKDIVIARQLRHKLSDLLEKFAHDNDAVVTDEIRQDKSVVKWVIVENFDFEENHFYECKRYSVCCCFKAYHLGTVCFATEEVAERAIKEVIIPFNEGRL